MTTVVDNIMGEQYCSILVVTMLVEVPMFMGVNNAMVVNKAKAAIGINYQGERQRQGG